MDIMQRMAHVHSHVTTRTVREGDKYGPFYIATCGVCCEESDECDSALIAWNNLALTNYGGVRP